MVERLREAVERHAKRDELLERVRPAFARSVEIGDAVSQSRAVRIDAAEEDAVLEDRVDAQHRSVELDLLLARVDSKEARDSAPAEQTQRWAISCAWPAASITRSNFPSSDRSVSRVQA